MWWPTRAELPQSVYTYTESIMGSLSCPKCFATFRRAAEEMSRGFMTCASCGHRFLTTVTPSRNIDTQSISTAELEKLLAQEEERSDEGDATRETTPAGPMELPEKQRASIKLLETDRIFPLTKFRFMIGREGADLECLDASVSRQHAIIENHSDRFLLKDLGSKNGTYVNGRKITIGFLSRGDVVRVGKTSFRFDV